MSLPGTLQPFYQMIWKRPFQHKPRRGNLFLPSYDGAHWLRGPFIGQNLLWLMKSLQILCRNNIWKSLSVVISRICYPQFKYLRCNNVDAIPTLLWQLEVKIKRLHLLGTCAIVVKLVQSIHFCRVWDNRSKHEYTFIVAHFLSFPGARAPKYALFLFLTGAWTLDLHWDFRNKAAVLR